jgi:hypothetical protein
MAPKRKTEQDSILERVMKLSRARKQLLLAAVNLIVADLNGVPVVVDEASRKLDKCAVDLVGAITSYTVAQDVERVRIQRETDHEKSAVEERESPSNS